MKLKFALWLVIVILLLPFRAAANQVPLPQEALLGYNPATGRVVIFEPQAGTANILLDDNIGDNKRVREVWRMGPKDFLLQAHDEGRTTYWTYWLSPDGLSDVSPLFDWAGWATAPDPVYFVEGQLVMLTRDSPFSSLHIIDLQNQQVQTFPAVDYIGPRLSADRTKLRFVALLPDTEDQWEVMEYDLTTRQTTPLNLLQVTNPESPFINTNEYGEYWLRRPDKTSPPDLIGLDGSIRTLDVPLTPSIWILSFNLRYDRVLAYDLACRTDCSAYVQPIKGGDWIAYPVPTLRNAIVYGLVDNRLVVVDGDKKLYLSVPDGPIQYLGYLSMGAALSISPGEAWSRDMNYLVFGDDPRVPTTIHLFSVATNEILLSRPAESADVLATYTAGGITLNVDGDYWFISNADTPPFSLPVQSSDLLYIRPQFLADGSVIYGVRSRDGSLFQVHYFDPRTDTEPSVMLDGVTLRAVSPMMER